MCKYRLNCARRTSRGWWNESEMTMPSRNIIRNSSPPCLSVSEAPKILNFYELAEKKHFCILYLNVRARGETRGLLLHQKGINPLTAGAAYIPVFIFYQHIKYHILGMLKIKCDINQQDLKTVDLHFVKSEQFSLT